MNKKNKKSKFEKLNETSGVGSSKKALLRWQAPQYLAHEKTALWYGVAGFVALLLIWYGLATDGWTFSLAILIFAGTYYFVSHQEPPVVTVKISKLGIHIGRQMFHFSELKGFWIVYDPPSLKRLYLRSHHRLHPDVFVALENTDPAELRAILKKHLPEFHGFHEPFSDTLVRLFKL